MGGPKTGKTSHYASRVVDRPVIHTDDWRDYPYESVPDLVMRRIQNMGSFVVEGVQVARMLRKGLEVDAVFLTTKPKAPRKPRHVSQAKGVMTVLRDWRQANPDVPLLIE